MGARIASSSMNASCGGLLRQQMAIRTDRAYGPRPLIGAALRSAAASASMVKASTLPSALRTERLNNADGRKAIKIRGQARGGIIEMAIAMAAVSNTNPVARIR